MKPEFTDQELNIISIICNKADPMEMISETKTIRAKIQAYFEAQQEAAIEKAAKEAVGEE